jgi:hypothetical protein
MTRYLVPLLFLIAAGVVWQWNSSHTTSQLMFPGVWLLPGLEDDIVAQGSATWKLLIGCSVLLFGSRIFGHVRERRADAD